ncbi:S-adenosyl-L-methionine-dependent methyltransferase [Thamnocephalis sphaerospora]|uniref:S-adenosyl-L-methionine-dependent methyltransferase n=1 Tax=Thamnocephalis sphaerospora TaxID=78915 RepID=A0A4P9XHR8_9FUNG|nr:S-adenosyl-L-methionine-dependent methyltransferase [Thamnocephalis sphaerospora]|eukprot:RKP05243.1 S-adenosyl-L-methionine-dependent methyltransferase [Thamnocephalis sphaerospora]
MTFDVGGCSALPSPPQNGGQLYRWLAPHLDPQASVPAKATVRTLDVVADGVAWIKAAAAAHPSAQHIGCSVSPDAEIEVDLPANCMLLRTDARDAALPFPDRHFDYARLCIPPLWTAIDPVNWVGMLAEVYRVLRPDAWLEVIRPADWAEIPEARRLARWLDEMTSGADARAAECDRIDSALQAAGFAAVQRSTVEAPTSAKKGTAGEAGQQCLQQAWAAISSRLSEVAPVSVKDITNTWHAYHRRLEKSGGTLAVTVWRAQRTQVRILFQGQAAVSNGVADRVSVCGTIGTPASSTHESAPWQGMPFRRATLTAVRASPATSDSGSHTAQLDERASVSSSKLRRRVTIARVVSRLIGGSKKQHEKQPALVDMHDVQDIDALYEAIVIALRGTRAAVLQSPKRVLDVSAGSGAWLKNMAVRHSDTSCIGVDITDAHFSMHLPLPPNCTLSAGNPLDGLAFPDEHFDYVYQCGFALNVPNADIDWDTTCQELYRVLMRGGQIELIETNLCSSGTGPAGKKLNGLVSDLAAKHSLGFGRVSVLNHKLLGAGFTKITRNVRHLRIGNWAGREGACARRYYRLSIERLQPHLEQLGVSAEELAATLHAWEEECESRKNVRLSLFCYLAVRPHEDALTLSSSDSHTPALPVSSLGQYIHKRGGSISKGIRRQFQSLRSSLILSRDAKSRKSGLLQLSAHLIHIMPRSSEENERLERQHIMLLHFLGSLHMAPVTQPARVLDVGTGTGCWAKSMSEEHPSCEVYGCDTDESIMPSLPLLGHGNFQYGDVTSELPFPSSHFDFVYQRDMLLALPAGDSGWPKTCAELCRVVAPKRYVELVETDRLLRSIGPAGEQLNDWLRRLAERYGIKLDAAQQLRRTMRRAGFERVHAQTLPCPHGEWGGRIGLSSKAVYRQFILGLVGCFATIGVQEEELIQALDALDKETEQTKGFINIYICCGRKPVEVALDTTAAPVDSAPPTPVRDTHILLTATYDKPLPKVPDDPDELEQTTASGTHLTLMPDEALLASS